MAKKIVGRGIDWETDGEKVKLPKKVIIDDPTDEMVEEVEEDGYCDEVIDRISDDYGWLINGVESIEVVGA